MDDDDLAVWADRSVKQSPRVAARDAREKAKSAFPQTRAKAAAIVAALTRAGKCVDCGESLTDPVSVAERRGPSCRIKNANGAA